MRNNSTSGQRRHVTVLFCDVSDSVRFGHRNDPEVVAGVRDVLERVSHQVISKHRGIVNQIYGDGVMALFGLSEPEEFDVRHAVEAALEIHSVVHEISSELVFDDQLDILMHSGIDTGLVLVEKGNPAQGMYKITGDAVNIAARLSAGARPDQILVTSNALQGAKEYFVIEKNEPLDVKGIDKPVGVELVLGRSEVFRQFETRILRGLSHFVGREPELERLEKCLDITLSGSMQFVRITGAAGVGKSRLAEEFLSRTHAVDVRVYRGYCIGHEKATPLQPFLQILRQIFGLDLEMSAQQAAELIKLVVSDLGPDFQADESDFLRILSIDTGDTGIERDELDQVITGPLVKLLVALADRHPIILFIDDWQWRDESSSRIIKMLAETGRASPVMVLTVVRDKNVAGGLEENAELLELEGFTEPESREAIRRLLPGLPDLGQVEGIYKRTGGNPLYIEELCHAGTKWALKDFSEHGRITVEGVPSWLCRLIESRVSRLSEEQFQVLCTAAVIGPVIPDWLLDRILGGEPRSDVIGHLAADDFLYAGTVKGTLNFKHGITREVVYNLVGLRERRNLHLRIADALKSDDVPGHPEEYYEALAHHYLHGADYYHAAQYAELAGDKSRRRSALESARFHYRAALDALDQLEQTGEIDERRNSINRRWAMACIYSPAREQVDKFKRELEQAQRKRDPEGILQSQYWLGYLNYSLGEYEEAIDYFQQCRALAGQGGNHTLKCDAIGGLGHCHAAVCRYSEALSCLDEAIDLWEQQPSPPEFRARHAYSITVKGAILGDMGDFPGAYEYIDRALQTARELNHHVEGSILAFRSLMLLWQGRWQEAQTTAESAQAIGKRVNGPYQFAIASSLNGYARWMLDQSSESIELLRQATEWLRGWGVHLYASLNYGWLADAMATAGRFNEAIEYFQRGREERAVIGECLGEAMACRALARISAQANLPDIEPPGYYLDMAYASARLRHSPHEEAVTLLQHAEIEASSGAGQNAIGLLEQAQHAFNTMDMRWHLKKAEILAQSVAADSKT